MSETGAETGESSLKRILVAEKKQKRKQEDWKKGQESRRKKRLAELPAGDFEKILSSQRVSENLSSPKRQVFEKQAKESMAFALEQSKARIK